MPHSGALPTPVEFRVAPQGASLPALADDHLEVKRDTEEQTFR